MRALRRTPSTWVLLGAGLIGPRAAGLIHLSARGALVEEFDRARGAKVRAPGALLKEDGGGVGLELPAGVMPGFEEAADLGTSMCGWGSPGAGCAARRLWTEGTCRGGSGPGGLSGSGTCSSRTGWLGEAGPLPWVPTKTRPEPGGVGGLGAGGGRGAHSPRRSLPRQDELPGGQAALRH